MSHNWDCPDEYEARARARRDAGYDVEFGWGQRYDSPYECDEASEEYRRAYRREFDYREEQTAEERRMEAARQRRREEECAEAAYWEQQAAEAYAYEQERAEAEPEEPLSDTPPP